MGVKDRDLGRIWRSPYTISSYIRLKTLLISQTCGAICITVSTFIGASVLLSWQASVDLFNRTSSWLSSSSASCCSTVSNQFLFNGNELSRVRPVTDNIELGGSEVLRENDEDHETDNGVENDIKSHVAAAEEAVAEPEADAGLTSDNTGERPSFLGVLARQFSGERFTEKGNEKKANQYDQQIAEEVVVVADVDADADADAETSFY